MDQFAPEKSKLIAHKNRLRQCWMTSALLKSSKTLDKLYKKCIGKSKESTAYSNFINYRNIFNKLKRIAKQKYYSETLCQYKYDVRKTWSILNTVIGRNAKKHTISDYVR